MLAAPGLHYIMCNQPLFKSTSLGLLCYNTYKWQHKADQQWISQCGLGSFHVTNAGGHNRHALMCALYAMCITAF